MDRGAPAHLCCQRPAPTGSTCLSRFSINEIRENFLTESTIQQLVKLADEALEGVAQAQRQGLETIELELVELERRLDRLYILVEITDLEINDILPRIREHRERQEGLESTAQEARTIFSQRGKVMEDVNTIAAYAQDMSEFSNESELTETRAFIKSFVREIVVMPGNALERYTVPMPDDTVIPGNDV